MITIVEAFNIASESDCFELSKVAYDDGDRWVFEPEDHGVPMSGGWPSAVRKEDGECIGLYFEDAFEFWDRCDSLPTVEVSL